MGLSIYYKGVFNPNACLAEMIEEVKEVAEAYHWEYHIFETEFPEEGKIYGPAQPELFGISFSPPKSEPVWLSFFHNRKSGDAISIYLDGGKALDKHEYSFTKTQYAGWQAHQVIIHLLKYISKKYFSEFELEDESHYWETNDEAVLIANFKKYNAMIESMVSALEHIPVNEGENMEEYLTRLLKIIQQKKGE